MKFKAFLPLALFITALFASCSSSKRTASVLISADTVTSHSRRVSNTDLYRSRHLEYRDTAIRIQARQVAGRLNIADLAPLYSSSGKPVPQTFRIDSAGLAAWIQVQVDGSLMYGCRADSLTIVIAGLIRQKDSLVSMASVRNDSSTHQVHRVTWSEFISKSRSWLNGNGWIAASAVLSLFVLVGLSHFIPTRK